MRDMGIWRRTCNPNNGNFKTKNGHVWLADGDCSIMTPWFDRDCMPKALIDDDDQPDSEESDNDYEDDFAIKFVTVKTIFYF